MAQQQRRQRKTWSHVLTDNEHLLNITQENCSGGQLTPLDLDVAACRGLRGPGIPARAKSPAGKLETSCGSVHVEIILC